MAGQETENLISAILSRDFERAEQYLRDGLDINDIGHSGRTALSAVSSGASLDLLKFVLDFNPDPDVECPAGSALHMAILHNNDDSLDMLLEAGASPNIQAPKSKETPILQTVRHGTVHACHALLAAGADPNYTDPNGEHPLHMAASYNKSEMFHALLEYGATSEKFTDEQRAYLVQYKPGYLASLEISEHKLKEEQAVQAKKDRITTRIENHRNLRHYHRRKRGR